MASIFASILRIYYRMVTDVDGHADFAKITSPFGGLGSSVMDVLFKRQILSPETCIDLCAIFGVENRDVLNHLFEKMAELHPSLRDEMIGCMSAIWQKLEDVTKRLQETAGTDTASQRQVSEYTAYCSDLFWNCSLLVQISPWVATAPPSDVDGALSGGRRADASFSLQRESRLFRRLLRAGQDSRGSEAYDSRGR